MLISKIDNSTMCWTDSSETAESASCMLKGLGLAKTRKLACFYTMERINISAQQLAKQKLIRTKPGSLLAALSSVVSLWGVICVFRSLLSCQEHHHLDCNSHMHLLRNVIHFQLCELPRESGMGLPLPCIE